MDKLKIYLPWVYRGVVTALIFILVWSWNSGRLAKDELSKALEREKLEKANLLVEIDMTKKQIGQREKDLLMSNADLEVEVARLKDAAGSVKVVEVVKWKTKVVEVPSDPHDKPRDCPTPGPDGKPAVEIALLAGDKGHAEVTEITYETRETNHVIVGKAWCYRDTPTSRLLFTSVVEAPVSLAAQLQAPPEKRWGAGVYMGFGKDGWAVGPDIALPPLHLWATQVEVNAGLGIGPGGQFQGGLSGIVRW
jgi:hypothetical protein